MSQAPSKLDLSPPTRDDWRAALAEWSDPVTGTPPEHLPDPLPEDLMGALAAFQRVDDHTPPASELEVASIVSAVRQSETEPRQHETISGWRWLAAMLAVACVGLWLWRGEEVDRSTPGVSTTGGAIVATSVVELYAGVLRSGSPNASTDILPTSDFTILLTAPNQLGARLTLDLVSGGRTFDHLDVTLDDAGYASAQIRRDLLPDGPLTLQLRSATDSEPIATWTLMPPEAQGESGS